MEQAAFHSICPMDLVVGAEVWSLRITRFRTKHIVSILTPHQGRLLRGKK